ncbi:hypothetical protein BDV93DRAFT_565237 [Ceratobasidium sp. AG-I]|nr:hypothetical protein BDV93DRAFT_565237 [Ceratobasidium sp. AG-I]
MSQNRQLMHNLFTAEPTTSEVYFGLHFDSSHDIRKENVLTEEFTGEVVSWVVQVPDDRPANSFGLFPRALQLLAPVYFVEECKRNNVKALGNGTWSAMRAGQEGGIWIGEAAGLRSVVGVDRASKRCHTIPLPLDLLSLSFPIRLLRPSLSRRPYANAQLPHALFAQVKFISSSSL